MVQEENKQETKSEAGELSFAQLFEESLKNFKDGEIVEGQIVCVRDRDVLIDIGYKSEGVLSKNEFSNPDEYVLGNSVQVLLESPENEDGMIVISKKKADRIRFWDDIVTNYDEGSIIEGKIFKKVKGGFMVDIGMEAFLPASLVDLKPTRNLDQFLGLTNQFKIVKINYKRKNIVLSRKDFIEQELQASRDKLLGEIKEGSVLNGRVKNITDFGAFIDLGGVDGLLHITDMSWGRVSHPSEILSIGDDIDVMVISFDQDTKRVSLGLKQKVQNPWEDADTKYPVNSKIKGKVVNILPYGAFIELEKGVEGLVHISELSWTKKINHPSELLNINDEVESIVLSVDKDNRKIALGIKQTDVNPWLLVEEKYEVGSVIKGKVRNITDYGVFLEIEPGIDGMIHISDISWLKKVNHPSEFFKKNQEVDARVLSIDQAARKISLGVKQLEEDPWKEMVREYVVGKIVVGTITKIVNFGIFVDLGNNLEGLVHISEIPETAATSLDTTYKAGEDLQVMILKVDVESRKIALSLKTDDQEAQQPEVEEGADESVEASDVSEDSQDAHEQSAESQDSPSEEKQEDNTEEITE